MFYDVMAELSHYASAMPTVFCLVLALRHLLAKRFADPPNGAWLIAGAFLVSYIGDTVGAPLGARHINNWWLGFIYSPIQFMLLGVAVVPRRAMRVFVFFALMAMGLVEYLPAWGNDRFNEPETVIQILGGLGLWSLWHRDRLPRYRGPVLLYCVGGAPFWLLMATIDMNAPAWLPVWSAYLIVRVLALSWMTWALTREEVAYAGLREHQERGSQVLRELGTWIPDLGGNPGRRMVKAQKR